MNVCVSVDITCFLPFFETRCACRLPMSHSRSFPFVRSPSVQLFYMSSCPCLAVTSPPFVERSCQNRLRGAAKVERKTTAVDAQRVETPLDSNGVLAVLRGCAPNSNKSKDKKKAASATTQQMRNADGIQTTLKRAQMKSKRYENANVTSDLRPVENIFERRMKTQNS